MTNFFGNLEDHTAGPNSHRFFQNNWTNRSTLILYLFARFMEAISLFRYEGFIYGEILLDLKTLIERFQSQGNKGTKQSQ